MKMHKQKHLNLVFENGWAFARSFWRSVSGNGFVRRIGVQCSKKREKPIQMHNALKSVTYLGVRRITGSQSAEAGVVRKLVLLIREKRMEE